MPILLLMSSQEASLACQPVYLMAATRSQLKLPHTCRVAQAYLAMDSSLLSSNLALSVALKFSVYLDFSPEMHSKQAGFALRASFTFHFQHEAIQANGFRLFASQGCLIAATFVFEFLEGSCPGGQMGDLRGLRHPYSKLICPGWHVKLKMSKY